MPYRGQLARIESQLADAEKRADDAESELAMLARMKTGRWWLAIGVLILMCASAVTASLLVPRAPAETLSVLAPRGVTDGPRSEWTWPASSSVDSGRGYDNVWDCELTLSDPDPDHPREPAPVRLWCGTGVRYEAPPLRLGDLRLGGCLMQHTHYTDRRGNIRVFCSESTVNERGRQRGPAISVDTVGQEIRLTAADGTVERFDIAGVPTLREGAPWQGSAGARHAPPPTESYRANASVTELDGMTASSLGTDTQCEISVQSVTTHNVQPDCLLKVQCAGATVYDGQGVCHHVNDELVRYIDVQPTEWVGYMGPARYGDHDPIALFDAALGRVRIADSSERNGYAMTLELDHQ